jgi:hypothetical protein
LFRVTGFGADRDRKLILIFGSSSVTNGDCANRLGDLSRLISNRDGALLLILFTRLRPYRNPQHRLTGLASPISDRD